MPFSWAYTLCTQ